MKVMLFDTETTGLIKNSALPLEVQPSVIEFFGLSCVQEGKEIKEVGKWESLFKYAKPLPEIIVKMTGIRDDDLVSAPFFKSKANDVAAFIEAHDRVVAHNLSFDMDMMTNEFRRINGHITWPKDRLCTVEATEHLKGHRISLTDIHIHLFGEAFPKAHRAETDVRAMYRCYVRLLEMGEI
jgi:DNA polymerase III epsilon subunit-like protein